MHEIQYPDVNSAHMCIALDCPVLLSLFIHLCPHRASTLLTYYPTLVLTKHKQSCPGTNKQSPPGLLKALQQPHCHPDLYLMLPLNLGGQTAVCLCVSVCLPVCFRAK